MTTDAERFELEYEVPVHEFVENYVKDLETYHLVVEELGKMFNKLVAQDCETMSQKDVAARWNLSPEQIDRILKEAENHSR